MVRANACRPQARQFVPLSGVTGIVSLHSGVEQEAQAVWAAHPRDEVVSPHKKLPDLCVPLGLDLSGVCVFLRQCGYDLSGGMESVICQLARRLCLRADFPHEIGIFLGYPLRDVVGFICNKGQNYSCCGHWKSYGDAEQAQQTFDAYKKCTACYQHLYEKGVPLLKLIAAA